MLRTVPCCCLVAKLCLTATPWTVDGGFPSGSAVKNLPAMQETEETWVQTVGQKDPLEEEMATHSSILAWRIPRTGEPDRLQFMGSQRVRRE